MNCDGCTNNKNGCINNKNEVKTLDKNIVIENPKEYVSDYGQVFRYHNGDGYVIDIHAFNKNASTPLVYHKRLTKTIYVLSGEFEVEVLKPIRWTKTVVRLKCGQCITIRKLAPHRVTAVGKGNNLIMVIAVLNVTKLPDVSKDVTVVRN